MTALVTYSSIPATNDPLFTDQHNKTYLRSYSKEEVSVGQSDVSIELSILETTTDPDIVTVILTIRQRRGNEETEETISVSVVE
jgi:hypothetical protein